MITETGKGLDVLIVTSPEEEGWQSFATWYSFYKNWPDAKISMLRLPSKTAGFVYFQWARRLNVLINTANHTFTPEESKNYDALNVLFGCATCEENHLIGKTVLVVKPFVMAVDTLSQKDLDRLNESTVIHDGHVWFMRGQNYGDLAGEVFVKDKVQDLTSEPLCVDAKASSLCSLVDYRKGCGKWINTAKGCPFSSAGGLMEVDMTANEHRVINLWKKMTTLFNAVM